MAPESELEQLEKRMSANNARITALKIQGPFSGLASLKNTIGVSIGLSAGKPYKNGFCCSCDKSPSNRLEIVRA